MSVLVVSEPGSSIGIRKGRVVVSKEGRPLVSLPARQLERVLVSGRVDLSGAALDLFLRNGQPVIFFDRLGRFLGQLAGPENGHAAVRIAQVRALDAEDSRLGLARRIVAAKIANQRTLVMRFQRRHAIDALAVLVQRMKQGQDESDRAKSLAALRGVEGAAARAYFEACSHMILNPALAFSGRNRRPPRDPVNACLSFGYALLLSRVGSAIHKVGLDPNVGALHDIARGRPSLALDLMEEWRAVVVDAVVLRLINRRRLGPNDFENPDAAVIAEALLESDDPAAVEDEIAGLPAPVYCGSLARKVLIREFHARLRERVQLPGASVSLKIADAIDAQAYACRRFLMAESPTYEPFRSS